MLVLRARIPDRPSTSPIGCWQPITLGRTSVERHLRGAAVGRRVPARAASVSGEDVRPEVSDPRRELEMVDPSADDALVPSRLPPRAARGAARLLVGSAGRVCGLGPGEAPLNDGEDERKARSAPPTDRCGAPHPAAHTLVIKISMGHMTRLFRPREPAWPAPSNLDPRTSEHEHYAAGTGLGAPPSPKPASILARSSSLPCEIGPLNHLLAESTHQPPTSTSVPTTAMIA